MEEFPELETPAELSYREALILGCVSDEYSLKFPTCQKITEELENLFNTSETRLYGRISLSLDAMKELGYIEDRELYGNSRPFQPTEKGLDLLDETNVFDYLEEHVDRQL